ncbi:alpha/beta hydrolase-fold protein [Mucilaginibacter sp. BT774]|uniref:alpha/beta hydrolase-fold protein n=1 Tax=Mucilaginibacter sp. BT774 TaxID=3062276 RepID=UPI0026761C6B|nr:alpha/beta hydrolase-fold protein [Mucilaginibacter sp. BT774]MDO3627469.1 alpha/beta hydrolase-fold protein [Mucilaginibacter sp. BT774]
MKQKLFLALLTLFTSVNASHAQDTVLRSPIHGKLDSLHSTVLNQVRLFQVFLPYDFKPEENKKYDVLYVLDGGNWNTGLVSQVQRFVQDQGFMPQTIIVSIMGIDRNVELTPTHLAEWKGSGGAPQFLAFIKNELIPFINQHYPSNGDNTLWGHSLSAMFAIYAMLNEPMLFKSFIAVDPSMWWDHSLVAKMAAARLGSLPLTNSTLYVAGRNGEALNGMKIDTLESILKQYAPTGFKWKVQPYDRETHSSLRFKATYDGLKYTYEGLTPTLLFHPMNGIVEKDKPIKLYIDGDTTGVHYTLDASMPTAGSPLVVQQQVINRPGIVTYRAMSNRPRYDKITTGTFTEEKPPVPAKISGNWHSGGFAYTYYEGNWSAWPDLKTIKPAKSGIFNKDFNLDSLPRKTHFALAIDGMFEAKEDGYYIFFINADKGSRLLLANKPVIEWDGDYNKPTFSYIVPLKKGFYPFRIEYLHQRQDFRLETGYIPPSKIAHMDAGPIPAELEFSRQ